MSHSTAATPSGHSAPHAGHDSHYVKIWAILLVLLVVSVVGPMFGIRFVTLITAFGIAIVKAGMVVRHFMHVNLERKYIGWMLVVMVALMALFVGGSAPDILSHEGQRWTNVAAQHAVTTGMAEAPAEHGK